jgi:predicted secreted protein
LFQDDRTVFKLFEEDYGERSFRITSLSRPPSRSISSRDLSQQSFFEAYITNQFKLGGRDLTVKSSQERISPALIEQMYKLFKTQLELEPKLSKFEGTVAREGQILTVDLAEPAINDASKLKKFLNTLFGH